ncbi:GSCOCG00010132001-RA-CDS [Cotesia congregata]|nr:GSCOCG00010132001-RA-CDS [Cotesia congregata]
MNKFIIYSIFLTLLALLTNVRSKKLIIDTDGGPDDSAAILLILSACANNDTNYEVVGITCVYGNTYEENVEQNVLKTLTLAKSQVPVYGGAKKPLVGEFKFDDYFGNDGFGDFKFEEEINGYVNRSAHAALVLIDLAKKYPGELDILVLGPLTNIAIAVTLDSNFMNNINRLYIMGGCIGGKKKPLVTDYNFGNDPDSNYIVLNAPKSGKVHLLYPKETVFKAAVSKEWRVNVFGKINSRVVSFLNKAEVKGLNRQSSTWRPADVMVAAVMLWPELITDAVKMNALPITAGKTRGALMIDHDGVSKKPKNVEFVRNIDVDKFKCKLLCYFS